MTADLLIIQLLEAVEVGDDGVYLKPDFSDKQGVQHFHRLNIIHPVHGNVGYISGYHSPKNNSFDISYVNVVDHPNYKSQRGRPTHPESYGSENTVSNYSGLSRTFVRAALRSLRKHIPNLETITGDNRITGTHAIARDRTGTDDRANTSVRIPRSMRRSV